MISEKALDLIISRVESCGKSYDAIAAASGLSKSTISRLIAKRQATMLTLDLLAAYFEIGEEWAAIVGEENRSTCHLAADIRAELKQIEAVYADREERFRQQSNERVESLKAQLELIKEHHSQALAKRDETYERSVSYLKEQIKTLSQSVIEAEKRAAQAETRSRDIDSRRNSVFWGMLGIIALQVIVIIVMFVVDAPGIGLGW